MADYNYVCVEMSLTFSYSLFFEFGFLSSISILRSYKKKAMIVYD